MVDFVEPDDDVLQRIFGGCKTSHIFLKAVCQFADEFFQLSVELVELRSKPEQNWRLFKQLEPVGHSFSCLTSDVLESTGGSKGASSSGLSWTGLSAAAGLYWNDVSKVDLDRRLVGTNDS